MAPSVGPTTVGVDGAVVSDGAGHVVAVAPGTFSTPVEVRIAAVDVSALPIPVPPAAFGYAFGGAFELDLKDELVNFPVQLAIRTTLAPGTQVLFYKLHDIPLETGYQQGWLELESGVVGADGVARTTSPPHGGIDRSGTYVLVGADEGVTRVNGTTRLNVSLNNPNLYQSAGIGGTILAAQGGTTNIILSLPIGRQSIRTTLVTDKGDLVSRQDNVEILPNAFNSFEARIFNTISIGPQLDIPDIVAAEIATATSMAGTEPLLKLSGYNLVRAPAPNEAPTGLTGTDTIRVVFGDVGTADLYKAIREHPADEVIKVGNGWVAKVATAERDGESRDVLMVRVPNTIALGQTPFTVIRIEGTWVDKGQAHPSAPKIQNKEGKVASIKIVRSTEREMEPVESHTFAVVASGPLSVGGGTRYVDQLVAMRPVSGAGLDGGPEIVARIPIGQMAKGGLPATTAGAFKVILSGDGALAFVSLRNGQIAVVDTMLLRQIDVDPTTPDVIDTIRIEGAQPYGMTLDKTGKYLIVGDELRPALYVVDVDPKSKTFGKHVYNLGLPPAADGGRGLRDIALTPDGSALVVTSPGRWGSTPMPMAGPASSASSPCQI